MITKYDLSTHILQTHCQTCVSHYGVITEGLDKLKEASKSVAQLSKDLVIKEKELAIASAKADKVD